MQRDFNVRKRIILAALGALVLADVILAAYSWQAARASTSPKQQLDAANLEYKLLKADIDRARRISKEIPTVQKDCDRFEKGLPAASGGYSALVGEIGDLAKKSGLRMDTLNYKQKDVANYPLREVQIDATVNGDYPGIVRFVNNMQRSQGMYILEDLTLATQNVQGAARQLRVTLHLRTYFRTV